MDGVLGEGGVANDPQRKAVGHAAVAVVERRQRLVVGAGDQRYERFVRQMCQIHSPHRAPVQAAPPPKPTTLSFTLPH